MKLRVVTQVVLSELDSPPPHPKDMLVMSKTAEYEYGQSDRAKFVNEVQAQLEDVKKYVEQLDR